MGNVFTTKHTYNQAFAIYALSGYYKASQNKEALHLAYSLYHTIEDKCRDGEWIEDVNPDNKVKAGQALVHPWKCPYHNGRMCIEMINRLSY